MYENLIGLANQMSISWQDLPDVVGKQLEQLNTAHKELQVLRKAILRYEAADMVTDAEAYQGVRLVHASYEGRPVPELRLLAEELKEFTDVVAFLASFDGHKVSLVVSCGSGTGKDARQLLNTQLAAIGGRGGGDDSLAQGGGVATAEQFNTFIRNVQIE
jgi:alanyl-tRNA synthetase